MAVTHVEKCLGCQWLTPLFSIYIIFTVFNTCILQPAHIIQHVCANEDTKAQYTKYTIHSIRVYNNETLSTMLYIEYFN